jgi:uncharacterized protein (DUF885 family)
MLNIYMENTQQPQENITLVDLDLIKNIIDLACTRGAFRGSEVRQVGEVYEKLSAFLEAVVAQAQKQEALNDGPEGQGE